MEWQRKITLPPSARVRLTAPIRETVNSVLSIRTWHTLPIHTKIWATYAQVISGLAADFQAILANGPARSDFNSIRIWVDELLRLRNRIFSTTLALAPFEFFEEEGAREMLSSLDWHLLEIKQQIEGSAPSLTVGPLSVSTEWLNVAEASPDDLIARALGVEPENLYDDDGEFSAGRVLSSYYLQYSQLLQKVFPHLASLGLPASGDLLAAVSAVGWILGCEDPVASYCSMNAFLAALSQTHGSDVNKASLRYLEDSEPALRQGRLRINRAVSGIAESAHETRHLSLADLYKRLIEGPFRKYGWTLHCLRLGHWSDPPMLTQLRETLVADGGWLGGLARQVVIRDIRNGEAHETLVWDGIRERFIADGVEVEASAVAYAAVLADAFARGCEAAIACYKALEAEHRPGPPEEQDLGRLAPWRRAEAIFGTNGIRVIRANFNSRVARITCIELKQDNINPCFQALVAIHRLLPHVERFEVVAPDAAEPTISVSRDALRRTFPIWEAALASFSAMPFSAFLPANLDARSRSESLPRATRSAAWIAVDDLLDALDGSADEWSAEEVELFSRRVALVALAVEQCLADVPEQAQVRLRAVRKAAGEMASWLGGISPPIQYRNVASAEPVAKFRYWWKEWGPVERLPSVAAPTSQPVAEDYRPMLRDDPGDLRWRTI